MVKLSSRHNISGCFDPAGNVGERGECEGVCSAEATMPHIGQPVLGAKAMSTVACVKNGMNGELAGCERSDKRGMDEEGKMEKEAEYVLKGSLSFQRLIYM